MKKFIAELMGSFFLVLTVLMTSGEMAPLAVGGITIAMMFAAGRISGGHLNPGVSLAQFIQGKIIRDELPVYLAGQVAGAILAAMIAGFLASCTVPAVTWDILTPQPLCGILCEFLGAFALVYVYLSTSAAEKEGGKLAVGILIVALTAVFAKISGGFFNPVLAVGAAISGLISWGNMLLFGMCHFLAGAAASTVYSLMMNDE